MKIYKLLGVLFWGVLACQAQPTDEPVTAFVQVNVLPMDRDTVLADQTVLVRGTRIVAVGPAAAVEIPENARRIDGRGRYLMPGLAEMHGHVPGGNAPAQYIEDVMWLYVANGVTTVRGMLGNPAQLELRERIQRGELIGPTLYLAGPAFSGRTVRTPEEAAEMVRRQKAEGWDLLKVQEGLRPEVYDAMARTAHEVGIRFAGHVPDAVGLRHALEMGQETFDHLDGFIAYLDAFDRPVDEARMAEIVRLTREARAWVVPTMALWEVLMGALELETVQAYDELRYMPPDIVARWVQAHERRLANPQLDRKAARQHIANRMRLLKALADGGVGILFGTDSPQQFSVPGFSVYREIERMEAAGLTPYQILRSATYNVGRYFQRHDSFGVVAVGHRADLILLEKNPLEDLDHLRRRVGVMVRGRWLSASELQTKLDEIAARYAR
ncbi:MAG: amidohydrolase family protein [Rhodothermus sp.]|nr:amidohydrolase family protein [Rhodothermus sp.]